MFLVEGPDTRRPTTPRETSTLKATWQQQSLAELHRYCSQHPRSCKMQAAL